MKTKSGHISIAEIREQMAANTLVANQRYQRSAGLWPVSAKSYFIDTILTDFPFQSVYVHEYVSRAFKKVKKDIVDGQQRLTVIKEFLDDGFSLAKTSKNFPGLKFSELDDDTQDAFLAYSVPLITISQASEADILEMFRRMNAFTVPLNEAEKRHSEFHGEFKWMINDLTDRYSPMLNSFGVLTQKQIVRMADAEFIADIADAIDRGIQNRQPAQLKKLYTKFDISFAEKDRYFEILSETLSYIRDQIGEIQNSFMCKSYAFWSLAVGLIHNRWGVPGGEQLLGCPPQGSFALDAAQALKNLQTLASAHETGDTEGPFGQYVIACSSTTHRIHQRATRAKFIIKALNNQL